MLDGHSATLWQDYIVLWGGKYSPQMRAENRMRPPPAHSKELRLLDYRAIVEDDHNAEKDAQDAKSVRLCAYDVVKCSGIAPSGRAYHSACAYRNDCIVMVGGLLENPQEQESCMRIIPTVDLARRRWLEVQASGDVPCARCHHASQYVPGTGSLFVHGGYPLLFNEDYSRREVTRKDLIGLQRELADVYELAMETMVWRRIDVTPSPNLWGHSAVLHHGSVIVFGGVDAETNADTGAIVVWNYKKKLWRWADCNNPDVSCSLHTATVLDRRSGAKMVVFGGLHMSEGQRVSGMHEFDLERGEWQRATEEVGDIPCGRIGHSMVAVGVSHLVLIGGVVEVMQTRTDPTSYTGVQEVLVPAQDESLYSFNADTKRWVRWVLVNRAAPRAVVEEAAAAPPIGLRGLAGARAKGRDAQGKKRVAYSSQLQEQPVNQPRSASRPFSNSVPRKDGPHQNVPQQQFEPQHREEMGYVDPNDGNRFPQGFHEQPQHAFGSSGAPQGYSEQQVPEPVAYPGIGSGRQLHGPSGENYSQHQQHHQQPIPAPPQEYGNQSWLGGNAAPQNHPHDQQQQQQQPSNQPAPAPQGYYDPKADERAHELARLAQENEALRSQLQTERQRREAQPVSSKQHKGRGQNPVETPVRSVAFNPNQDASAPGEPLQSSSDWWSHANESSNLPPPLPPSPIRSYRDRRDSLPSPHRQPQRGGSEQEGGRKPGRLDGAQVLAEMGPLMNVARRNYGSRGNGVSGQKEEVDNNGNPISPTVGVLSRHVIEKMTGVIDGAAAGERAALPPHMLHTEPNLDPLSYMRPTAASAKWRGVDRETWGVTPATETTATEETSAGEAAQAGAAEGQSNHVPGLVPTLAFRSTSSQTTTRRQPRADPSRTYAEPMHYDRTYRESPRHQQDYHTTSRSVRGAEDEVPMSIERSGTADPATTSPLPSSHAQSRYQQQPTSSTTYRSHDATPSMGPTYRSHNAAQSISPTHRSQELAQSTSPTAAATYRSQHTAQSVGPTATTHRSHVAAPISTPSSAGHAERTQNLYNAPTYDSPMATADRARSGTSYASTNASGAGTQRTNRTIHSMLVNQTP